MNNSLIELQEQVTKEAVKMVDVNKVAVKLSKKLEKSIEEGIDSFINDSDISYWIKEELEDENSVAGKAFQKVITQITAKMAKSIKIQ